MAAEVGRGQRRSAGGVRRGGWKSHFGLPGVIHVANPVDRLLTAVTTSSTSFLSILLFHIVVLDSAFRFLEIILMYLEFHLHLSSKRKA